MSTALVPAEQQPDALVAYLATIDGPVALEHQRKLAAAYDHACNALIGPNDVQQEGARSFKKKSAWRKLARHFRISVAAALDNVRVDRDAEGGFTAFAVATASAPWGQSWTDVGACGSDEATGRRTITVADAIATAMTRASNRAVSNLIAMGEVSAEEIGDRKPYDSSPRQSPKSNTEKKWPFGEKKGTPLGDFPSDELEKMLKWCREKGKTDIADAIRNVLNDRALGDPGELERFPTALVDGPDDLPF